MRALFLLVIRYPWYVLAVIAAVTAAAGLQIDHLEVDVSGQSLRARHTPEAERYQEFLERYGGGETSVVVLHDPDLFHPDRLAAIREAVQALSALPFVTATHSLYSVPNVKTVDKLVSLKPYLDTLPPDRATASALIEEALTNPFVARNLLSADGTTMAVQLDLRAGGDGDMADAVIVVAIEAVLAPLRGMLAEVFQIGPSVVREAMAERIRADQLRIMPAAVAVLLVVLALALRTWIAMLLPLLTAGLSIIWTLGLMAALDIPVGVLTSLLPALLVIIGSTEDIHLLAEYQAAVRTAHSRHGAVRVMGLRLSTALALTAGTTCAGFLSLAANDLEPLQEFAYLAAGGLLLNYVITVTLIPIILSLAGPLGAQGRPGAGARLTEVASRSLARIVFGRKGLLVGGALVAVAVALAGLTRLQVENNTLAYFPSGSALVERTAFTRERLGGTNTISVVLRGDIEGTFLKVRYLRAVQDLQAWLEHQPGVDKTLSFADFLGVVDRGLSDEPGARVALPETDDLVREYMAFIDHRTVAAYVRRDFSEARIVVRHHLDASTALLGLIDALRAHDAAHVDPGLHLEVTGGDVLSAQGIEALIVGQAQSLVLMTFVIFGLVSVLFVTPRAGLVAVVPNLFPILALLGFMGYAGIPLDSTTAIVGAIALGISVDDTLHFMVRYHQHTRRGVTEQEAISRTLAEELTPIVSTSVALAIGFAVFLLSSFPPVAHFGLLSALVMVVALFATFLLTPLMLAHFRLITLWDVLSLRLRREVLGGCPLFRGLRPGQTRRVVLLSEVSEVPEGQPVFRQGDVGDSLHIVLEGTVEIWRTQADHARERVSVGGPGQVLGEIALIARTPRTADVMSVTRTRLLTLRWETLDRIARQYPRIAARLFRNLADVVAERLASAEARSVLVRDAESGAYSLSYFREHLRLELERADRYGGPSSLVVLRCNATRLREDQGGDPERVRCLRVMAGFIERSTRAFDVTARLAGDSLVVLLARGGMAEAERVLARLRSLCCECSRGPGPDPPFDVAIIERRDEETAEQLLERALAPLELRSLGPCRGADTA